MLSVLSNGLEVDHFKFFGSLKFYTLFTMLTYFLGNPQTGNELLILLVSSGLVLFLIKMIVSYLSEDLSMPSVTTGLATVFLLFIVQKRPVRLFVILATFVTLMVHLCKLLDSYTGCMSKTLLEVASGTFVGALLFLNRGVFVPTLGDRN